MKQLTSFPDWLAVGGASCRNPCFGGVGKLVSKIEEGYARMRIAQLMRWLRGEPFVQVGRHAIVNLRAIQKVWRQSDRVYRLRMHDRTGTVVNASRSGSTRLLAAFKARTGSQTLTVPVSRSHRKVAAPF